MVRGEILDQLGNGAFVVCACVFDLQVLIDKSKPVHLIVAFGRPLAVVLRGDVLEGKECLSFGSP